MMGQNVMSATRSYWKRRWDLTVYSLLGLQVTGICWSADGSAVKGGQTPTSSNVATAAATDQSTGDIVQVGHRCSDPNCDQCRPRRRRGVCPPEWYMQSPLWQSMIGDNGVATPAVPGVIGDPGMAGQDGGAAGAAGNAGDAAGVPGFMDLASANPSNLAPNIIGDLFGSGNINVVGISAIVTGTYSIVDNQPTNNGLISVLSTGNLNEFYAPLADPNNVNSGPGSVTTNPDGTIGSNSSPKLYLFSGPNNTVTPVQAVDNQGNVIPAVDAQGNPVYATLQASQIGNSASYSISQYQTQAGAVNRVGQLRIAENVSPMPRDRIFFNYSYFQDAQFSNAFKANVNRFTPGFEKTFSNGNASFEFRAPFATSIDPNISIGGATNSGDLAWGNLNMTLKTLWYRSDTFAFSTGLQVVVPTAEDTKLDSLYTTDAKVDAKITNGSTHLMPFGGFLYTPDDRFFSQGFLQLDVDANGNGVYANEFLMDPNANNQMPSLFIKRIGTQYDTTSLYTSTSAGYWVYRSESPTTFVQGWAPVMELHSANSLERADIVQRGKFSVGSTNRHTEVINMVLGMHTQLRDRRFISAAYAFPVTGQADRQFQGEFRLMFNQLFGPVNRQTSAGFFGG